MKPIVLSCLLGSLLDPNALLACAQSAEVAVSIGSVPIFQEQLVRGNQLLTQQKSDDPELRALLNKNSVDGTTLVMLTNFGFLDFTFNAICSLHQLEMHKFVVLATDAAAFQRLQDAGVPSYFNQSLTGEVEGGAVNLEDNLESYRQIVLLKLRLVQELIGYDMNIILSDVDVVWLENMIPALAASPKDLLFLWVRQCDYHPPHSIPTEKHTQTHTRKATDIYTNKYFPGRPEQYFYARANERGIL
jgi:hypothetical protein